MAKTSSGAMAHINNADGHNGTGVDPLGVYYFCPISIAESNFIWRDGIVDLVIEAAAYGLKYQLMRRKLLQIKSMLGYHNSQQL